MKSRKRSSRTGTKRRLTAAALNGLEARAALAGLSARLGLSQMELLKILVAAGTEVVKRSAKPKRPSAAIYGLAGERYVGPPGKLLGVNWKAIAVDRNEIIIKQQAMLTVLSRALEIGSWHIAGLKQIREQWAETMQQLADAVREIADWKRRCLNSTEHIQDLQRRLEAANRKRWWQWTGRELLGKVIGGGA